MDKRDVLAWISLGIQITILLGGLAVYILTLPTKDDLKNSLDARIKPIEARIESIEASLRDLKNDVDTLDRMHRPPNVKFEEAPQPSSR